MPIEPGTHRFGPDAATLSVHTGRSGAAAKAGHDLVLRVTDWHGVLEAGGAGPTRMELTADAASLRVNRASGGIKALGDDDKVDIHRTIDDKVLRRRDIVFRSTRVQGAGEGPIGVEGDLTLNGATRPVAFDLHVAADGALAATIVVRQTDWGMKPYSALLGALKVRDEVEVVFEGHRSR